MGMHADDAIGESLDEDDLRFQFLHGGMDIIEAFDRGIVDGHGGMMHPYQPATTKTCRCCGATGLTWGKHQGEWRLFRGTLLHHCPTNPLRRTP